VGAISSISYFKKYQESEDVSVIYNLQKEKLNSSLKLHGQLRGPQGKTALLEGSHGFGNSLTSNTSNRSFKRAHVAHVVLEYNDNVMRTCKLLGSHIGIFFNCALHRGEALQPNS
jgi:hypothetical protein